MLRRSTLRGALSVAAFVFQCLLTGVAASSAAEDEAIDDFLKELADTPLNLNRAGVQEIALLPGVSLSAAEAIVERREKSGRFSSLSVLIGLGGLTEPDIARFRPYVTLGSRSPAPGKLRLEAEGSLWRTGGITHSGATAMGGAGDIYVERGETRLRVRYRSENLCPIGGVRVGVGKTFVTCGDVRVHGILPLAVEVGRDTFSPNGSFAGASLEPGLPARGVETGATTGAGERLRGFVAESRGPFQMISMAGAVIGPWGRKSDPVGLVSVRCLNRTSFDLWAGGTGAVRRSGSSGGDETVGILNAAAIWSALWRSESARCSADLAVGASGGAWMVSLGTKPEAWSRVGLALAGRWGRYVNPIGVRRFRSEEGPDMLARAVAAARPGWIGSISVEQLMDSEAARETRQRRVITWRRRLKRGAWIEGNFRDESQGGLRIAEDTSAKLIWRPSRESWAELLCKLAGHAGRVSTIIGWRAGAGGALFKFEMGGFSFRCDRALYLYEKEIVGRSSIKALKGEGIGWYLCMRLGPDSDSGLASLLGPTEFKLRSVARWDTQVSCTFVGVQIGRRGG